MADIMCPARYDYALGLPKPHLWELKDSDSQNRLSGGRKSFVNTILKEVAFVYLCVYVYI